jgi:hypothetical protein
MRPDGSRLADFSQRFCGSLTSAAESESVLIVLV